MAKPILTIRVNEDYSQSFSKVQKSIRKQLNDEYHVLLIGQVGLEDPIINVYNVDKEEPINYSQLKKLINKEVE